MAASPPRITPTINAASKTPTNKLSHRPTEFRSRSCPLGIKKIPEEIIHHRAARFKRQLSLQTPDDCEETLTGETSYPSKDLMEHPYVPPLAVHGFSMDTGGAHYKDALRLGLPFHLDAAYLEPVRGQRFPYGRLSYFPFHVPLGACDYSFEPAFIRKRNERERHRVRCVNEGYARLREHLPREFEDKRLSKVETLRAAIDYIKHLQSLLDLNASGMMQTSLGHEQRTECNSDGESQTGLSDSGELVY